MVRVSARFPAFVDSSTRLRPSIDRQNEKDHSASNRGSAQEISRVVGIIPTKIAAGVILILVLVWSCCR